MINFETELDLAGTARLTRPAPRTQVATQVAVSSEVTVTPRRSEARAFVARQDVTWDWSDLRDYVVAKIEEQHGAFPRDMKKEAGIFKAFLARHGDRAASVARFAFEVEGGFWGGAPISVNRFCKGSDKYFSDVIKARLDEPTATVAF